MSGRNIKTWLGQKTPTLGVGLLTADLMSLGTELTLLEQAEVPIVHIDVMDGCFCPPLTVGPCFIKALKTPLLKDVHLMIERPLDKIEAYVAAGADIVTVHVEGGRHTHRALQMLGTQVNVNDPSRGILRGLGLNPGTPLESVKALLDEVDLITLLAVNPGWSGQGFIKATERRLRDLRAMIGHTDSDILLAVDGGVTQQNITEVATWGADIIVTGSAVFDGNNPLKNAKTMLEAQKAATSCGTEVAG